ncbi:MAG: DUF962 domain-containing protein [Sphingobacteriales bacterium]|nr:DUF962 domain-containing protein [Sphingobacteriales bacterium]
MKTIDEWLSLYGRDHQHPTNKLIHWICVPVIFFTVLGLFWCIPVPAFMGKINFGIVVYLLSLVFYLSLSIPLFIGFLLAGALCLAFSSALFIYFGRQNYAIILGIVFVVAWIGQFIGHKLEGQKPSFFEDVQFLLIGPAWLLHFIYQKIGISYK